MANQAMRGGMKKGAAHKGEEKKHQGVRPGSSATKKERTNKSARQKIVPDARGGKSKSR